ADSSSTDDSLFGAETVTQSSTDAATSAPQKDFLKYDVTKVGGRIDGSLGWALTWADPWTKAIDLATPDARSLTPALSGSVKITAKPSTDYGVYMEFRTSNPFSTSETALTSASYVTLPSAGVTTSSTTFSIPNISVWSLYSQFSWNDSFNFSFGKQPLAWGVSKSYFQPADDIFALTAVDNTDTGAEREGPIAFKAQYGIPLTMTNFYFYAGVPDKTGLDLGDLRIAAKAETNIGNTEMAAGAYYAYNDYPRAILEATTGFGNLNFFGEAVGKWGSERYFLSPGVILPTGAQKADQLWFSGTVGGYYIDGDNNITVSASYFYNGEGQTGVSALQAFQYFVANSAQADRMHFGTHYASASFSKTKLLVDNLSVGVYALGDLSDQSYMVVPSVTWQFFDYLSVAIGSTMTFGPDGSEYPTLGSMGLAAVNASLLGKPSASISITATMGSGAF
ncbi:MAG TPA: hypothetical protein VMV44_03880, partial [Rectinemataceae bacterium]|nr:hypothetical protein [Rectinemataceae bacterium]